MPETIFLNLGQMTEEEWNEVKDKDFDQLRNEWEITWCEDKVFEHDIEFVRKDTIKQPVGWHRYDTDRPDKEMSALVIHADTSFGIHYTRKGKKGYFLPRSERGYIPLFWMEVPQVPNELTVNIKAR